MKAEEGNLSGALCMLQAALKLAPRDLNCLALACRCLEGLERHTEAIAAAERLCGVDPASTFLALREVFHSKPEDVFVVTFPRCGTTWMVQIVVSCLFGPLAHYEDHAIFLEGSIASSASYVRQIEELPRPRVFKSHVPADMYPGLAHGKDNVLQRYGKVVYVVRNPKDAMISLRHHHANNQSIGWDGSWDEWVDQWIRGQRSLEYGGSYFDHVKGWWKLSRHHPDRVRIVYFEDLKADLAREIKAVADFLGLPLTNKAVTEAAARCQFDAMRQRHQVAEDIRSRVNPDHFRAGEVGSLDRYARRCLDCPCSYQSVGWRKTSTTNRGRTRPGESKEVAGSSRSGSKKQSMQHYDITHSGRFKRMSYETRLEGWDAFRSLEADCFQKTAASNKVILIDRPIDDIVATLETLGVCQNLPDDGTMVCIVGSDTYKRRLPKYAPGVQAADFRFPVARGEADLQSLTSTFARFVGALEVAASLGQLAPAVVSDSFFITLTASDYNQVSPEILRSAARAADLLEFRVDLLGSLEHADIVHQVATVRRIAPGTPLLYTVRSSDHGGKFTGSEDEYFELNKLGLQLCAEFLDVECTWSATNIAALAARRGPSKLVGSYHNFDRFKNCLLDGAASIAKVVVKPKVREDNWIVQEVGKASVPQTGETAFIGLCLGETGKLSRVLNQVMCPSMHPGLTPGAPGQMSVQDILTIRRSLSLFGTSRQFAVIRPWESSCTTQCSKASGFYRDFFSTYFKLLDLPHVCVLDFASTAQEACRLAFLASTGGTLLLDALRGHFSQEVEEATGVCRTEMAKSSGFVDCIVGNTKAAGHALKSQALVDKLQGQTCKRTALVLGSGPARAAMIGGLQAAGFDEIRFCDMGSSCVVCLVCFAEASTRGAATGHWEPSEALSEVRSGKALDVVVSIEPPGFFWPPPHPGPVRLPATWRD
ncbi:SULT6B1 [Symbiodinium natans]|uniref:SULT6B1 protein n=1 Tax=Symbiodinium natans TaxID=878477 RepID=A0A812S9P6_9DINO|nr:SULT6B1 [Symbiodinium natans]